MQSGTGTRVDAVLSALLQLVEAAKPDSKVSVFDGDQPLNQANDAIIVAPSDASTPGVVVTYGRDPALGNANVEQIEVALICRSYAGDKDLGPRRARCAAMFAAIQGLVNANQRRDACWDKLELGPQAVWHPVYTEKGCNCFVGFSLIATALV